MTFIRKYKDYILDGLQILLLFLLGFKFLNLQLVFSIILFIFLLVRYFFQNRFLEIKKQVKHELFDLIVLFVFLTTTPIIKSYFDRGNIFSNFFHFSFLPLMFWLSVRTLSSDISLNGCTSIVSYFVGCFFFICFCKGYTFAQFGLKSNVRMFYDIWTKEVISSTIASLYLLPIFLMCISLFVYFVSKKKTALFSVIFIIPILVCLYISIRLSNRGFFVAGLISIYFLAYVLFFLFDTRKSTKNIYILYILLGVSVVMLGFALAIAFNLFGFKDKLMGIPFFYRFLTGGTDSLRSQIYRDFFANALHYPMGGLLQSGVIKSGKYVHNSIFDLYGVTGILPTLCFLYFIIRFMIFGSFKKTYSKNILFSLIFLTLFYGALSISFFEPTISANGYYFAAFFAFFSIVSRDTNLFIKPEIKKLSEEKKGEFQTSN